MGEKREGADSPPPPPSGARVKVPCRTLRAPPASESLRRPLRAPGHALENVEPAIAEPSQLTVLARKFSNFVLIMNNITNNIITNVNDTQCFLHSFGLRFPQIRISPNVAFCGTCNLNMMHKAHFRSPKLVRTFRTSFGTFRNLYGLVMSITENRNTDTKPNTNRNRGEIPKPNQLRNMRKIPTFYLFLSLLTCAP